MMPPGAHLADGANWATVQQMVAHRQHVLLGQQVVLWAVTQVLLFATWHNL
jgi:hypothetical protein